MKRWLWQAWHGVVVAVSTVLAIGAAVFMLPALALMEYEARTDWE